MRARSRLFGGLLALVLAGCAAPATTSPGPPNSSRICPPLNPTLIPSGFEIAERSWVEAGEDFLADTVIYRHPDGRFLAFVSGSPGPIGGVPTGQRVMVRGHDAEIFREASLNELAVIWQEASADEPCHLYSISVGGLTVPEFMEILAGVR